jgi:hypothetical protein
MKSKLHIEYKMYYMYDTLTINGKEIVTAEEGTRIDAEEMLDYIQHELSDHMTVDSKWVDED